MFGHLVKIYVIIHYSGLILEKLTGFLLRKLRLEILIAFTSIGTLSEIDGRLQLGEVHRTIKTVDRYGIIRLIVLVVVVPMVLIPPLQARAISSALIRILRAPANISKLFIDFPHLIHMLLKIFLLVLINVSHLQLIDIILVLLNVCLRLLGVFIGPKKVFHVFAMLLDCKVFKKADENTH